MNPEKDSRNGPSASATTVRLAIAGCAVALAVGVSACGDDSDGGSEAEGGGGEAQFDLVVGDLLPLSGDLADFGPPSEKSADLARDQIEATIGELELDQSIEVLHEDTQTDPQAAVSAARKVVTEDASCLTGPFSTAETIPVAESVAVPEKILQITPGSTSDDTTAVEDDGLLNRTILANRLQGPALADLVEESIGGAQGKVVNVGARNDAYGTGLAETFAKAWEEKGGEIGTEVMYDPERPSYDSEAAQIVDGDPDAFAIIDFPETFAVIGPALARTGDWDPSKAFITEGLYSTALPEDVGEDVVEGMRGTNPGSPDDDPAAQAFDALYKGAPGPAERQSSDAQTFDAVILCYLAAVAAGGTDGPAMAAELQAVSGPPGEQYTFEQLSEAVEALQNGEDIDYQGAAGPIDLDDNGDPTAGAYDLFTYKDGKLEQTGEVLVGE